MAIQFPYRMTVSESEFKMCQYMHKKCSPFRALLYVKGNRHRHVYVCVCKYLLEVIQLRFSFAK